MVKKFLIFLAGATLFSGLFVSTSYAYEVETHAFLTDETIQFYNRNFKNKISDDLKDYLVDGARKEDDSPRYLNHFYDPINDQGLASGIYRGHKSKEWAENEKLQNKLIYKISPFTVASILTASQIEKIQPIFNKTNFTWQKAIDFYIDGKMEQALFALGHVLHLVEDASVPDHTRNDAHPPFDDGGSPYENWTEKFNLENPDEDLTQRLLNKKPIPLNDLDSYFNEMAEYSNKNFYSRDSIYEYNEPKIVDFLEDDKLPTGYVYGIGEGNIHLVLGKSKNEFSWSYVSNEENKFPLSNVQLDEIVIRDYWNHLSVKSVQYTAGVINLFFKEAEVAKAKYEREKAGRPYLGTLIDGFKAIFGSGDGNNAGSGNLIAQIPIENKSEPDSKNDSETEGITELEQILTDNIDDTEIIDRTLTEITNSPKPKPKLEPEPIQTEIVALQLCGFGSTSLTTSNTSQTPSHQSVVINEVAWMGTANSANDEWIELKNISAGELDISGWQVVDMAEQIKVRLDGGLAGRR